MPRKGTGALPVELLGLRGQFERWRCSRVGRSRVPGELWDLATRMAERHGLSRVARVAGLNVRILRRRMAGDDRAAPTMETPGDAAGFVEVRPLASALGQTGWRIEVRDRNGARLRVGSLGPAPVDVVALVGAFVGGR